MQQTEVLLGMTCKLQSTSLGTSAVLWPWVDPVNCRAPAYFSCALAMGGSSGSIGGGGKLWPRRPSLPDFQLLPRISRKIRNFSKVNAIRECDTSLCKCNAYGGMSKL